MDIQDMPRATGGIRRGLKKNELALQERERSQNFSR